MPSEKFRDLKVTAKGEPRASVTLHKLETLWFNTGTRCNLSCENCYIESNPKNDRLSFLTVHDVKSYLDEIEDANIPTQEIGLTGGEPFLNPQIIEIMELCLSRGFATLVLTNAFRLKKYFSQLKRLADTYGDRLTLRVSLDHYRKEIHELERGVGTFEPTLQNMKKLYSLGLSLAVAGRSLANDDEIQAKQNYRNLLESLGIHLHWEAPSSLVVFPEMNMQYEVPEITTSCWEILSKKPEQMMCSSSRMVVKRKDEKKTKVLACTLLAYDKQFELGDSLKESEKKVYLNHPFCAQFCVLGGASCS